MAFSIKSHVGTLGTNARMSHLDLNIVGWYNHMPKADLRYWNDENLPDGKSGGITLDIQQLRNLKALLNSIDLDSDDGMFLTIGTSLNTNDQLCEVRNASMKQQEEPPKTPYIW